MPEPTGTHVYSVSQLNHRARLLLEEDLPPMWVSGEVSNLARPASGHIYFSLKDDRAQIRCAMFRGANRGLSFSPANGQQVLVHGRVSIFEPRGDYQMILEHMEPAGEGLLRRQLEELKQKLAAEGIFAAEHKVPLPALPRAIGVITSPTGAAIRDILHILARRFPLAPVVVYPVQVQGEQAKFDIEAALATATRRAEVDVLILARGGGSLEDLWAFNEENVARAIFACPIPVVSGVGHEIDFTLADLVADVRAPTPSGAAELVVPDQREWLRHLVAVERRGAQAMLRSLAGQAAEARQLAARLQRGHPGYLLRQNAQHLDELRQRLAGSLRRRLALESLRIESAGDRLRAHAPAARIRFAAAGLREATRRLQAATHLGLNRAGGQLAILCGRLQAVSPLNTLERGYAIVTDASGRIVRQASALSAGDEVNLRLAAGSVAATVRRTTP